MPPIHPHQTDELWSYVGKKQKRVTRKDGIALASSAKAIIAYHTGKRDSDNCDRTDASPKAHDGVAVNAGDPFG
jgi:hypothetical protein